MAYIEIITIKGGQAACSNYFYAASKKICVGEAAYIPDSELEKHLESQLVHQVSASSASARLVNPSDAPRPGRKPSED